jgi:hypothetical protein
MDYILFKKCVPETLLVTDAKNVFKITNTYFKFRESNYPFDSLQFSEYLKTQRVVIVQIGENFPHAELFEKYLVKDEYVEEQKEEQKVIFEEKVKQDKLLEDKEQKKREQSEKKEEEARLKKELERKNNMIVIDDSTIEENVSKHLMG